MSNIFSLPCDVGNKVRVCRATFVKAVQPIKKSRLNGVLKRNFLTGSSAKETRGGDHKTTKYAEKKKKVKDFIGSLKCRESHYGRKKSIRVYLPGEMKSIRNLYQIFQSSLKHQELLQVSFSFFYKIFVTCFNIGFSSPRKDSCTACERLSNEIKIMSNPRDKQEKITLLRIHKMRAQAFYALLKEKNEKTYSIVYDMQQVHILPKVSVQEAYYSRQLALYNFGLCDVSNDKTYSYAWTENQSGRGSNEIGSAVNHFLSNVFKEESTSATVEFLRLFSDGCGGQNKNNVIIGMVQDWLSNGAPPNVKSVELIFPVRGHSFLPADRLFGRIEKDLKTMDTIINPHEYHAVFAKHCTKVFKLNSDWYVVDWKRLTSSRYRILPNLQEMKRVKISKAPNGTKILVCGEISYRSDVASAQSLLKRGQSHTSRKPAAIAANRHIAPAKLKDIRNLLKVFYGANWNELDELKFYKNLSESGNLNDNDDTIFDCNCAEEDLAIRI